MKARLLALVLLAVTTSPALACITFPTVVSTSPGRHAPAVDPSTREIVVTFSEPMDPDGWSIVAAEGGLAPELAGSPKFSPDGRTARIPVRLAPGATYAFWLNHGEQRRFRSRDGAPAVPAYVKFHTRR